jgi:hypothetical protein
VSGIGKSARVFTPAGAYIGGLSQLVAVRALSRRGRPARA